MDLEGPCAGPAVFGDRSICLVTQVGLPEHSSDMELVRKGTIHKGRPHWRGGRGVLEKQKNADMGEGGVLPIRTSFLRNLIRRFQVLDSCQFGQDPHAKFNIFTVGKTVYSCQKSSSS